MKHFILFLIICLFLITGCSDIPPTGPIEYFDTGINSDNWAFIPAGEFLKGQYEHETILDYDYEIVFACFDSGTYGPEWYLIEIKNPINNMFLNNGRYL